MKILDLWVPGVPRTKGSMNHIGGGQMTQSVAGSTAWAGVIRRAVRGAIERGQAGYAERAVPVHVQMSFWVRGADVVAERAGDVDKLARNVLDALTRDHKRNYPGVYADDVQVIRCDAVRLPMQDSGPGLHVVVTALRISDCLDAARLAGHHAMYAHREATDPTFRHRDGAQLGHDCFVMDCGSV